MSRRPDLLALIVYLVLATANVILLYYLAYAPAEISYVGAIPTWYLVCTIGGGIVFMLAGAAIIFGCYKDEDFIVDKKDIVVPLQGLEKKDERVA